MPRLPLSLLAVVATATLLAGCGLGERFQSPEDRINRLMPPALAVRNAAEQLAAIPEPTAGANAAVDAQRLSRLKLRALNCARDVTPRWLDSDDSLRQRLTDKACFAAADKELSRWLNLVRVGRMLAQGPLRPIPAQPPALIATTEFISTMAFAERAGVAMLGGSNRLATVDIGTGSEIWHEDRGYGVGAPTMSANGRLFRGATNGAATIRAADTGEVLVEFAPRQNFAWLDARHLVIFDGQKNSVDLLELATGQQVPIAGLRQTGAGWGVALPVPGTADRFVLLMSGQAYQLEMAHQDGQLLTRLLAEQTGVPNWGMVNTTLLSADGATAIDGQQTLAFLNLKDLALTKVPLEPMRPVSALPTANPDEFLVTAAANGDGASVVRQYVMSRSANTLALSETDPTAGGRWVWLPSLKALGLAKERSIAVLPTPKAGAPKQISEAVADALDEINRRKLARMDGAMAPVLSTGSAPAQGATAPWTAIAVPQVPVVADAPMAALAADAQIEGVGVYQGAGAVSRPGQPRAAGNVEVRVRRSAKPIVLVLSSYEPVQWKLVPESGARIAVVLVGGYYPSTVVGAGPARIVQIGREYAYSRDSEGFPGLQRTVARTVGRPIGLFQSRYEGASFSVGGS